MDAIKIPESEVVPLDDVAVDVQGLRIVFVNVFGVAHRDQSWTLIDAGLPMSEHLIRSWAEKHFQGAPNAIVLTHGHFDHVSSAKALAEHWNVPIYAHKLEHPYLTGAREYDAPNFAAGGGMMSLMSPLLPRGPVNLGGRLRQIEKATDAQPIDVQKSNVQQSNVQQSNVQQGETEGLSLSEMPGWQIIHTPGHTPGHVSLFRSEDRLLLAGDAFCTTKPESFFKSSIAQAPELHGPPAYFTSNWDQARYSVQKLAQLEPHTLAPGHGKPIAAAEVPELLKELASRFEEIAVPDNRKSEAA